MRSIVEEALTKARDEPVSPSQNNEDLDQILAELKIGEEAALENEQEIRAVVSGCDMVFITVGLGGGTGTGVAPVVAKAAREEGALTIAIVTLPFAAEGAIRMEDAGAGVE